MSVSVCITAVQFLKAFDVQQVAVYTREHECVSHLGDSSPDEQAWQQPRWWLWLGHDQPAALTVGGDPHHLLAAFLGWKKPICSQKALAISQHV